jgi:hypothetical protein
VRGAQSGDVGDVGAQPCGAGRRGGAQERHRLLAEGEEVFSALVRGRTARWGLRAGRS